MAPRQACLHVSKGVQFDSPRRVSIEISVNTDTERASNQPQDITPKRLIASYCQPGQITHQQPKRYTLQAIHLHQTPRQKNDRQS